MDRNASATWTGTLEEGRGELRTESGVLDNTHYTFTTRFGDDHGTNPEELIGAAHAGCYSMALSKMLSDKGIEAARIDTDAEVTLENTDGKPTITGIHLGTRIEAPGADPETVEEVAQAARRECVVSRALDTEITLEATLVN